MEFVFQKERYGKVLKIFYALLIILWAPFLYSRYTPFLSLQLHAIPFLCSYPAWSWFFGEGKESAAQQLPNQHPRVKESVMCWLGLRQLPWVNSRLLTSHSIAESSRWRQAAGMEKRELWLLGTAAAQQSSSC